MLLPLTLVRVCKSAKPIRPGGTAVVLPFGGCLFPNFNTGSWFSHLFSDQPLHTALTPLLTESNAGLPCTLHHWPLCLGEKGIIMAMILPHSHPVVRTALAHTGALHLLRCTYCSPIFPPLPHSICLVTSFSHLCRAAAGSVGFSAFRLTESWCLRNINEASSLTLLWSKSTPEPTYINKIFNQCTDIQPPFIEHLPYARYCSKHGR